MKFRALTAKETECRVKSFIQKPSWSGVMLLLYKNARVDMDILDETVGAENWKRHHYECKGNLFCTVSINVNYYIPEGKPNWVEKSDCGAESLTDKEKGESSDSFKRACFNWGIGRELYTAPRILIPADCCNIYNDSKGKAKCDDKFYVHEMEVKDGRITHLVIYNANLKKDVFFYPKKQ